MLLLIAQHIAALLPIIGNEGCHKPLCLSLTWTETCDLNKIVVKLNQYCIFFPISPYSDMQDITQYILLSKCQRNVLVIWFTSSIYFFFANRRITVSLIKTNRWVNKLCAYICPIFLYSIHFLWRGGALTRLSSYGNKSKLRLYGVWLRELSRPEQTASLSSTILV